VFLLCRYFFIFPALCVSYDHHNTPCLKKLCQLIFWSLSVNYEPISIKITKIIPEYYILTKLCLKFPLHLKYVLALPWKI